MNVELLNMKWKNIEAEAGYYYITGTVTEWLPLLTRVDVRQRVLDDITVAIRECEGQLAAYVIMPEHVHLLVYLPDGGLLAKFNKLWRGRSGRHIPAMLECSLETETLAILAKHANGGCRYAVWKEQVRALGIYSRRKLYEKIGYIHANPVRRGLVAHPAEWPHSSWRFYENGEDAELPMSPPEP